MSELILVEGDSGVGKTTAMRNLDPNSTFYINVSGKPLPLPGWKGDYSPQIEVNNKSDIQRIDEENGNYASTDTSSAICSIMKYIDSQREDIDQVIIDDFQYMSAFEFFERASEKGWDKFNEIGQHIFEVLNTGRELRTDLKVAILTHTQETGGEFDKNISMKTIGKPFCRCKSFLIAGNPLGQSAAKLEREGSTTIPRGST